LRTSSACSSALRYCSNSPLKCNAKLQRPPRARGVSGTAVRALRSPTSLACVDSRLCEAGL
jgi:hypothetical protein